MSTKVCVEPVKPGWKDTVTLGQLESMIAAFGELGFDGSTPVTYLYDQRHVWLETVHDVDDDFDIAVEPEPRVWQSSNDVPEGVVVEDDYGSHWRWRYSRRYLKCAGESDWDAGVWVTDGDDSETMRIYAPFTEVLS